LVQEPDARALDTNGVKNDAGNFALQDHAEGSRTATLSEHLDLMRAVAGFDFESARDGNVTVGRDGRVVRTIQKHRELAATGMLRADSVTVGRGAPVVRTTQKHRELAATGMLQVTYLEA